MSKTVEFWFDYGSPTAYVGHWRLKEVARRTGAAIDLRPMLLGAVFQATDNHTPVQIVPKGKWMFWDLENYAERHGIPFVMNPYFIINTLPLMRGALVAERRDELERYTDVMFNAVWRDGLDMGDPKVIGEMLTKNDFEAGIRLYREGRFENALACFETCLERYPEDGAAILYRERCEHSLRMSPDGSGDGSEGG